IRAWFSSSDPDYIAYEDYRDTFEGGRFLIVALRSKDIFSFDILNYIKQKTEEFENLPHVKQVHSLANANKVIGTAGSIEINPLLSKLETINLQKIKKDAIEDRLFRDYLISSNGKFAAIAISFEEMDVKETDEAIHQFKKVAYTGKPEDLELFLAGDLRQMFEFNRFSKQNQKIFPFIVIPLICIFIFILFRSLSKVFITLLVIGMSLCWALGFYSTLGYTFNVVTAMLIPLVIILSVSDCIHIMEYFDETERNYSYNKKETFINTITHITTPCFLTSITTAFGLMSLSISSIDAVKHFGIGSAAGIIFAFLICIIVVPHLLSLLSFSPQKYPVGNSFSNTQKKDKGWEYLLNGISKINEKKPKYILIVAIIGFIFFSWGIKKVKIETNQLEWFPKKEDFYQSAMLVDKNLFGIGNMEIVVKGEEGALKEPDILKRMDNLDSEIEKLPHVKKVISLTDYIKRINEALEKDDPAHYKIPNSESLVAQELFLFSLSDDGRKELDKIVTPDYSQGRISVKTEYILSDENIILADLLKKMAEKTFSETGMSIILTGPTYLYNLLHKYILKSQIMGFSIAFLLIIGIMFIAFWSVRYGVLSIMPNLLPIIFIIGIMGWSGFKLNTGTVMVASVALGIAVDDTIHF
ncbi:MAG: efflux RND transporter permease subunit, partial [Elusimicrobiota bacterium]